MNRFFGSVLLLAMFACSNHADSSDESPFPLDHAVAWQRWETALTSSKAYPNPYRDVTVSVTYDGPNWEHFQADVFWDGDQTFRLRFMFPSAGKWHWRTTCTDATNQGLHDQSGEVTVSKPSGNNPLYTHGYPKVSEDRHYLTYADGTAFLWMADTAWAAPLVATQDPTLKEWKDYVDQRVAQKFNVIQVHTGKAWLTDPQREPFAKADESLRWNPDYWQKIDEMVKYANDQGVLVFFAAIRQPGDGFPTGDDGDSKAAEPHIRRFAQMFVARMMGSFVVFSPIADDEWTAMADMAGEELANSSSIHLVTAHPRFKLGDLDPARTFYDKDYTDFAGLQSGNGWRHNPYAHEKSKPFSAPLAVQQAIEWPLEFYAKGKKPVLNLEMVYDGKDLQDGDNPGRYLQPYPPRLVRSTAYLTMLSGAKGVTYGCSDVWSWGMSRSSDGEDFAQGRAENLRVALSQDSAQHMAYMFGLFSSLEWWRLVPSHELIQNQSSDWLTKMVMATTPDGTLGVAYLPDINNKEIELRMDEFVGLVTAQWFNPVTNMRQTESSKVANADVHMFVKPAGWEDAVLILTAK